MIQRLVQNLSLSSARDQSFRPDVKKNNSAHGTTSHMNKNIKIKKPEAVTTDIKGGPKRERLITDSTANSLNKRNGGHLLHDRGATESQSGKERQPQLRTTSNGRSGGFDGVISEQKDNNGCKDVDHSVLEYSDSDSDERVRRRDHDNSGRYADHFSSRVRSAENVRSREPDEYEDDFENYSTEEDPEPAMPPPPAYQPQRLHIDDERNSLQAQSKAFAPRSDDDVDAFNFADRSLNGAQAFLRGDQSVPEDSNRDTKYRNGSDKETSTSRQNRGGEKAMSANISGLQQKAAPDKSSRLISGLSGGHGASSSQAPLRSVSARGQSKDVNQPKHPSQARRRGDDSKGSMMGRGNATNSNSTGDRNARVISNSTSSLTSNSAVADQRAILEQRALERRERVLFLQKQSEERVISRLRETEHQIKYVFYEKNSPFSFYNDINY